MINQNPEHRFYGQTDQSNSLIAIKNHFRPSSVRLTFGPLCQLDGRVILQHQTFQSSPPNFCLDPPTEHPFQSEFTFPFHFSERINFSNSSLISDCFL